MKHLQMKSILSSFEIYIKQSIIQSFLVSYYSRNNIIQFVAVIDKLIKFRVGEEIIQNYYIQFENPDKFSNFVITCLVSQLSV